MYTGIIEEVGSVLAREEHASILTLIFSACDVLTGVALGDSLGVNGVCLTVTAFDAHCFTAQVVPETLRLTTLGQLVVGDAVNLERSMQASSRIGGHFIQGHVDAMAKIMMIEPEGDALLVTFSMPASQHDFLVKKGFVAIDGMSITVVNVVPDQFQVTFIPYTQAHSIVRNYQVGTWVNIETDMMGKYIVNFLRSRNEC